MKNKILIIGTALALFVLALAAVPAGAYQTSASWAQDDTGCFDQGTLCSEQTCEYYASGNTDPYARWTTGTCDAAENEGYALSRFEGAVNDGDIQTARDQIRQFREERSEGFYTDERFRTNAAFLIQKRIAILEKKGYDLSELKAAIEDKDFREARDLIRQFRIEHQKAFNNGDAPDGQTEEPADEVVDETTDEQTEEPADEVVDETTDEQTEEPADEVVDETTDEQTDEVVDETTDEQTDEPADEVVDETTDEQTEEPADEVVDETPDEQTDESSSIINENPEYLSEKTLEIEKAIFDYTNVERQNNGLEPLVWDDALSSIARDHSVDMTENSYFSHTNLDGEGPTDRAIEQDYTVNKDLGDGWYSTGIGENIAKMPTGNVIGIGYISNDVDSVAKALVTSWMESPGHRANILNSGYDNLGIGVAYDGLYYVATQDFW